MEVPDERVASSGDGSLLEDPYDPF